MPSRPLAPDWYEDPYGTGALRWFDGARWTQDVRPAGLKPVLPPTTATESERRSWPLGVWQWSVILAAVLLVAAGGVYFGAKTDKASPGGVGSNDATGASGASTSTAPPGLPDAAEFLATSSTSVDFIQWNDDGGALSGTAQEVSTQGVAPDLRTVTDTFGLSGSVNGSAISMSFNHGVQVFGTVVSGSFTVLFPQPAGTMGLVTFQSATSTQYSGAVAALSEQIDQENQSAAGVQALQQSEQTVDNQVAKVQSDISDLTQDETATASGVQAIGGSLQGQTKQVMMTGQQEQQVSDDSASSDQSKTCGDASVLAGDASVVAGDAQDVAGEASAVEATLSAVSGMRAAIAQLNGDYSQLQKDEAALPDYVPPNAPSQSEVAAALSTANSAVQSAVSTTNGDIDEANTGVSTAYGYVAQGYQAARDCGSAPTAPPPLQHIS